MQLTRAERFSIRENLQTEEAVAVASRYGISRSRVYQLRNEDPATWRSDAVNFKPKETAFLQFRKKNAHLNSAAIQQAIASSLNSDPWLAKYHCTSLYAITRIYQHWKGTRRIGRPNGKRRGEPKPPLTPEQLQAKRQKAVAASSRWNKRWRQANPELARQKNLAAYKRGKAKLKAAALAT